MTVNEMIQMLQDIKDKSLPVCVWYYEQTGYCSSCFDIDTELGTIKNIKFVSADKLGGLCKFEAVDHIELIYKDD